MMYDCTKGNLVWL